ncbi:protein NRT1/ PTR FAMILY 2.8 [Cornus florida]|uniref:protein NRT1/ PTR FAMILY 2.8 n=1 Tax=Cornus florida TaxID=4283 RepID=UPI0028A0A37C|nr:protein NRT1/ PTR FAMILY 2.8 [Cornus florida]
MEMEEEKHSSTRGENPPPPPRLKPGGWIAIAYILGNETFERLASMSLISNLTVYLHTQYNIGGILLVNTVNIWSGSSNVTTIAGAFLADAYLGRFLTILFGLIISSLGMGMVAITAGTPQLRPPDCHGESSCPQPKTWQLVFLFSSLGLLAIGSGGIRPCNIAFGADQFDTRTEKGKSQLKSFYNWWYFSFTIALLVALTAVVYIQTNVSWVWGYAIPTACFALAILIFLCGRPVYVCIEPQGSVLVDMIKVINAAIRKRCVTLGPDSKFYDPPSEDSNQKPYFLARTNRFKYLDKAAIICDPTEVNAEGVQSNSWRLCSVQQVEQLKCVVGIVPVWFTGIACFIAMDQMSTFGILQVLQSNRSIGSFKVPPAWMGLSSMIALALWIFIYECIYVPYAQKSTEKDIRMSTKRKVQIGIVMSIICMLVAGFAEQIRRESALKQGSFASPISVALLLPQFALSGMIEAFSAVAIMEFFNNQMPASMRSMAGSLFFLSLSMASYLSSVLSNLVHTLSQSKGKPPWVGGHDLNSNRLEYFYFIIAALGGINFIYFNFFACHYMFSDVGSQYIDSL